MREIVGFVMGAAAGAAGALFATSTEGRALIERLKEEARPETERAATEWEPLLREVSRAVRLAVRELETATVDLRARIGEIAAERPDDEVELAVAGAAPVSVVAAAEPEPVTEAATTAGAVGSVEAGPPADPVREAEGAAEPAPTT